MTQSKLPFHRWVLLLLAANWGCSEPAEDSTPEVALPPAPTDGVVAEQLPYQPCLDAERIGDFRVELAAEYTRIDGKVFDSPSSRQASVPLLSEGDCELLQPPALVCEPLCAFSTQECTASGCVPLPEALDLGTLHVYGMALNMALEAHPITKKYSNPAEPALPNPGYQPGADIRLVASPGEESLQLRGWGVAALVADEAGTDIVSGQAATVRWEAPGFAGPARIVAELNLDNHGSSNAAIRCDFADTGTGEIPAALIERLLGAGTSGFPTLLLHRRTVTSASYLNHCVQLQVGSRASSPLVVDGLVSCNQTEDCPDGTTCTPLARICE